MWRDAHWNNLLHKICWVCVDIAKPCVWLCMEKSGLKKAARFPIFQIIYVFAQADATKTVISAISMSVRHCPGQNRLWKNDDHNKKVLIGYIVVFM